MILSNDHICTCPHYPHRRRLSIFPDSRRKRFFLLYGLPDSGCLYLRFSVHLVPAKGRQRRQEFVRTLEQDQQFYALNGWLDVGINCILHCKANYSDACVFDEISRFGCRSGDDCEDPSIREQAPTQSPTEPPSMSPTPSPTSVPTSDPISIFIFRFLFAYFQSFTFHPTFYCEHKITILHFISLFSSSFVFSNQISFYFIISSHFYIHFYFANFL